MEPHRSRPGHRYGMPVYCCWCGDEIEHCDGAHGEWMHTATRAEACRTGGFAQPESAEVVSYNFSTGGRPRRLKRRTVAA